MTLSSLKIYEISKEPSFKNALPNIFPSISLLAAISLKLTKYFMRDGSNFFFLIGFKLHKTRSILIGFLYQVQKLFLMNISLRVAGNNLNEAY